MEKRSVWSRTPLRLGLAGGGTDLSDFSSIQGGRVVNATINRFVHVRVSESHEKPTQFISYDTGEISELGVSESSGNMPLFRKSLENILRIGKIADYPPILVESFSDSPVGSGLGTSSSLCVGLLNALSKWFNVPIKKHDLAELAYKVEREDCGFSGGMQDQFAAAYGGLNDMIFHPEGRVSVSKISSESSFRKTLEASLILYFTGKSRDSSAIIEGQRRKIVESDSVAFEALVKMKSNATNLIQSIEDGDIDRFAKIIREGWEDKKRTSSSISSNSLEQIITRSYERGAIGAKISGAGGGGFMLLVVPFENRNRVITWLRGMDGIVMTCNFTKEGSTAWLQ